MAMKCAASTSRSPYGERGLKFMDGKEDEYIYPSLSLRRAWIEMHSSGRPARLSMVALLTESVD